MAARPDAHGVNYSGAAGGGGGWDYLEFDMTDLRQAAQQALEAAEKRLPLIGQASIINELNALREALAQPEQKQTVRQRYIDGIEDAIALLQDCGENSIDWLLDRLTDYKYSAEIAYLAAPDISAKYAIKTEQWTGCGECDCAFSCHNGEARCIRLQPEPAKRQWNRGCGVCGIGANGKAMGYVCTQSDCPTRVTCGGVA